MINQTLETSPKVYARIAGLLYLINIIFGFFAIGYVSALVSVAGDAVATSRNVLAHEQLYRLGLVAHIIILVTNVPLAVIFWRLFKIVNRNAALMVVFFTVVGTAIESANLLNEFAPLILLSDASYLKAIPQEQLQSLSYMLLCLEGIGFNLALVFFGFYGICIGYLIYKSTFLPRLIGVFMAIGGMCYLVNSFVTFLAPTFAHNLFPYIQLPSGLAELTFCLWMLIGGVKVARWKAIASE